MNETGRERQALFPSPRKLTGELLFAFGQPEFIEAFTHRLFPVFYVVQTRDEIEIFLDAQVLPKTEPLRHVTDFAFDRFTLGDHVVSEDLPASLVGAE